MLPKIICTRLSIGLAGFALAFAAHAGDIRDQLDVQTGKAELVIPAMSPQDVAAKVKDAVSQWAIPANSNFRTLPSTIPARPDEPVAVQRYIAGAPIMEYQCQTAFAEITKRPPPVRNAFMFNAEALQACVYPFQKGVKVYLVYTSVKKTESLTSGLFNGITRAIRGNDGDWMTKQLNENIGSIKKNIPSLLIEKIEVPGLPVQEPDKAEVAALIPEKEIPVVKLSPPQPTPAQNQVAAQVAAPAMTPTQAKIEARKNLNAMGMTYHSQEQFIAAIRRKDDVAVQLFMDAGAIDLTAKEKNGKTPFDIANDVGAADIAKLIGDRIKNPSGQLVPAASAAQAPAEPAPTAAPQPGSPQPAAAAADKKKAVEAAAASLPSEMLAKITSQIDAMSLPPEKKELYREQLILQASQFKAFTDRIDPETGRLR